MSMIARCARTATLITRHEQVSGERPSLHLERSRYRLFTGRVQARRNRRFRLQREEQVPGSPESPEAAMSCTEHQRSAATTVGRFMRACDAPCRAHHEIKREQALARSRRRNYRLAVMTSRVTVYFFVGIVSSMMTTYWYPPPKSLSLASFP